MLIALLALLGVDLGVLLAVAAVTITRRQWVKRQPGAFRGRIRVTDGTVDGLKPKWSAGYGRWVRDVLVWTKGPLLFRNELLAVDGVDPAGPADPHEVKRLGDKPLVGRLRVGGATVEIAADGKDHELLIPGG